ncbi:MAG: glycosyltransferase family 2 protein [Anaerolineaceae bacterium]
MSKDVSVIVPNLHSAVLGKTIQSLLEQQTSLSYEVIVVGQDKYRLIPEHPLVQSVETEKLTPSGKARNLLCKVLTGIASVLSEDSCVFVCPHARDL